MPVFAYQGMDARGRDVAGVRDAESPRALRQVMRREGVYLTAVSAQAEGAAPGRGLRREVRIGRVFSRISQGDVAALTRRMGTLVRAGIPLADALAALVEQAEGDEMRRVLAGVREKVNEGSSLADALAQHPKVFPPLYTNMVRAGETSGNLEEVLLRLAEFLEAQNRLRGKVVAAMVYPAIMTVVGVGLVSFLMVVVVPKITQVFADLGQSLPLYTQLLIFVSHVTGNYWWAMLAAVVLAWWGFSRWRRTPRGRERWDAWMLRLWFVGETVRMVALARFSRTLGTMLRSGVGLLAALDIVKHILGNVVLLRVIEEARDQVREGAALADPLRKSGQFPAMVTQMIAVGERSGQLEGMLENVALAYETEVDLRLQRMTTLLEPLMIVIMGGVVGFIIFSILMPILAMNQGIDM